MTYEEFVEIMDNSNFMIDSSSPYDMKILDALKKQIPKKPIRYVTAFPSCCMVSKCPNCGQEFGFNTGFNFCENCGQRLDFRSESIDNEDE